MLIYKLRKYILIQVYLKFYFLFCVSKKNIGTACMVENHQYNVWFTRRRFHGVVKEKTRNDALHLSTQWIDQDVINTRNLITFFCCFSFIPPSFFRDKYLVEKWLFLFIPPDWFVQMNIICEISCLLKYILVPILQPDIVLIHKILH